MKNRMLAGVACAALIGLSLPARAATSAPLPIAASDTGNDVGAFYAARGGSPLWLRSGADSSAARELIGILQRAALDGMPEGPALAGQAQALLARAETGDPAALSDADRLLSAGWVRYVQALQRPPEGMTYADAWVAPRRDSAATILARTAAAPSLSAYVHKVSAVNPLYAQLRDAAWSAAEANGGQIDPRVLASLDRARDVPPDGRYVMVDTAGARLYMIDDGQVVDSMKVIVGKADPSTQTPMLASTIYYATLNPYWHVDAPLVRSLIARNVLDQGLSYLSRQGYQVMDPGSGELLDPAKVDWHAVAAGDESVQVRQLPGPRNSMGRIKIGFPNSSDIYLHDTPNKTLFDQDDRTLSHGCIRLEDAERLGQWLLERDPETVASAGPEQNVLLPQPVPIYVTYLTARVQDGQLSFVDDIYGRDGRGEQVAALR